MKIGDKLFNFKLKASSGLQYSNYDFADKYAFVIIVSCLHCPYAQAYWNRIFKLASGYEEDSLCIVAVNPNDSEKYPEDSFENMGKFLKKKKKENFIFLHDETQEIARKLGATRTPEAFLFNFNRELVYRGAIDDCWDNESLVTMGYLEDAIEYCLDGLEIDYPEVEPVGCSIKWKQGNEPSR
jgi:hypothetical protein